MIRIHAVHNYTAWFLDITEHSSPGKFWWLVYHQGCHWCSPELQSLNSSAFSGPPIKPMTYQEQFLRNLFSKKNLFVGFLKLLLLLLPLLLLLLIIIIVITVIMMINQILSTYFSYTNPNLFPNIHGPPSTACYNLVVP